MKKALEIYVEGKVEDRLPQLDIHESPLKLRSNSQGYCLFDTEDSSFEDYLVYGSLDPKILSQNPIHIGAQKDLGFKVGSHLYSDKSELTPGRIQGLGKILDHLETQKIPYYTTEIGEETFARGYNPVTNVRI